MTPVSYVILGLLHIARMSLYDLMKAFEAGVSLFYGSSAGSIKRSLDKLLAEGAVEVTRQEPGAADAGNTGSRPWAGRNSRRGCKPRSGGTSTSRGLPGSISWVSSLRPIAHRSSRDSGNASPRNSNDWNPWNGRSPNKRYPMSTGTSAGFNQGRPPLRTVIGHAATYDWLTAFEAEVKGREEAE